MTLCDEVEKGEEIAPSRGDSLRIFKIPEHLLDSSRAPCLRCVYGTLFTNEWYCIRTQYFKGYKQKPKEA